MITKRSLSDQIRKIRRPRLSLVVIVFDMPRQAMNTLFSLSTRYQTNIETWQYEVLVIEAQSSRNLCPKEVSALEGDFHYYRVPNTGSPATAVNFGLKKSKGHFQAVLIDGARLASPGLIKHLYLASLISRQVIISVPGYHLGSETQQEAVNNGYNEQQEIQLLDSINWRKQGYKLFEISCWSESTQYGLFRQYGESNCLCLSRGLWKQLGGMDESFCLPGGGLVNLDTYKRALELPHTVLIALAGEGVFHQYHGGVTTNQKREKRAEYLRQAFIEYKKIRGEDFYPDSRIPTLLGEIHRELQTPFSDSFKQLGDTSE
ncbi:glycosyltransferase family 2 protein [Ketobacter sp. MCCC 1A13808]|uniref:glycosyltransferase family 2 protein n=1 Tax=Ketobacter sp. MCCC 1A13808 TaxID=2602738 RepID=UPI0012EC69C8|nr:glycosyltransferase family 2 protein [Ketobacter sp. MCCC 1A13808]MVF13772.1 glycosyltransferase family 2 protein [Ketobacter sp. MCCC 1A13808]